MQIISYSTVSRYIIVRYRYPTYLKILPSNSGLNHSPRKVLLPKYTYKNSYVSLLKGGTHTATHHTA